VQTFGVSCLRHPVNPRRAANPEDGSTCIFALKTFIHNIQSSIKQDTCFGLLSHHQAHISNIKKILDTEIGVRSQTLHVIIHKRICEENFNTRFQYAYMCIYDKVRTYRN
jgi:hypothetical protein